MGRTLLDKIWDAHTVRTEDGGRSVLYIDRQYIHEVTSPVAFAGLERRGIGVARPAQITATADHNIPTEGQAKGVAAALRTALGKDPEIETRVDPSILGGIKVRVGSRLFDASLRSKLDSLKFALKRA